MKDPTNTDRAYWAEIAADLFSATTGSEPGGREQLVDLLADLHHLADRRGLPWAELLAWADVHYQAETEEAQRCPNCGTTADEDGYCTDVGCASCGKAVIV